MARPPRLPDAAILELIHELRGRHSVLTGTQVRDELRRRYGAPCGVARVYRLLAAATAPWPMPHVAPPRSTPALDDTDIRAELAAALARARLAEDREESHQTRWAAEIDRLREQIRTHKEAARRLPLLQAELQDRSRELAAAYKRLADLEVQLR
jgi:hypothetical protein